MNTEAVDRPITKPTHRPFGFLLFVMLVGPSYAQDLSTSRVADGDDYAYYGASSGLSSYSMAVTACNVGSVPIIWNATVGQAPLISTSMFRIDESEQMTMLGYAWPFEGFCAVNESTCGSCQSTSCATLGIGCSNTYSSGLLDGASGVGRFEVNPTTGEKLVTNWTGPTGPLPMRGRIQMPTSAILDSDSIYIAEATHISEADHMAGNARNNAAWQEFQFQSQSPANIDNVGVPHPFDPAIFAWKHYFPDVHISEVVNANEGGLGVHGYLFVGSKATLQPSGYYRYDYCVYNFNSEQAASSLSIATDAQTVNSTFHGVDHHSGSPWNNSPWNQTTGGGNVGWACQESYAQNPNANAIRWGMMYTLSFDSLSPPSASLGTAELELFEPGVGSTLAVDVTVPDGVSLPNCAETTFNSNGGGAFGGAVYFDLTTHHDIAFYGLETNYSGPAGSLVGMDVFECTGSYAPNVSNPSSWTLIARDNGAAISAGAGNRTQISFHEPLLLTSGTRGIALVATGAGHLYTDGTGSNQIAASTSGTHSLLMGAASDVPFTAPTDTPVVWNGSLCSQGYVAQCLPLGNLTQLAPVNIVTNIVPTAWEAPQVEWTGDVSPRNKIDDTIDNSLDPTFEIVVNFNRLILSDDISLLQNMVGSGTIQLELKRIPSVAMGGVTAAEVASIALLEQVAFIERQVDFEVFTDVSLGAMKVLPSPIYSNDTLADAFPLLLGDGVNIAIMDSGVGGNFLEAFEDVNFVGGYDAGLDLITDPMDSRPDGHGTGMAAIALGSNLSSGYRGVAPKAGLIDVSVGLNNFSWCNVAQAFRLLYSKFWDVRVINMSIGTSASTSSDDVTAIANLVNQSAAHDILVVAAVGNAQPNNTSIGVPASVHRALTVGAVDDRDTVDRIGDSVWSGSLRGPLMDDGDSNCIEELKPEVTAYGVHIRIPTNVGTPAVPNWQWDERNGTSLAAAHVSGLAALLMQQFPHLPSRSIRQLIISTAEQRGTPSTTCDPTWNDAFGWGIVDAYAAVLSIPSADIRFPSTANPVWNSPDIQTIPQIPRAGQKTTVSAMIENTGSVLETNVAIHFGVCVYETSNPNFDSIGTVYMDLLPGLNKVTIDSWMPSSEEHQCLEVFINSPRDPDMTNNKARRNLKVAASPVTFLVRNAFTSTPSQVDINVSCEGAQGWTVVLSHNSVMLGGEDHPVRVSALAIPSESVADGETGTFHVSTSIGNTLVGGITFLATKEDCNGNGVDDYFDIIGGVSLDNDSNGKPDECDVGGTGVPFCYPMDPNSTGLSTVLTGNFGTGVGSDLHLEVTNGVPTHFAYALVGTAPDEPGLAISQGRLCLSLIAPNVWGRYNIGGGVLSSIGQFDASGILQNVVGTSTVGSGFDVPNTLPLPGSPNITAGSTWHFQVWHRENGGASNFSNGLSVTF